MLVIPGLKGVGGDNAASGLTVQLDQPTLETRQQETEQARWAPSEGALWPPRGRTDKTQVQDISPEQMTMVKSMVRGSRSRELGRVEMLIQHPTQDESMTQKLVGVGRG